MTAQADHGARYWKAALLMLGSALFFGLMAVAIRLASKTLHTFEIAFFRNFFGLLAATPLLLRHGTQILRTTQFPRYIFRCVIGVLGMFAGFWAIGHLPLAQAVSLSYSTPLFVTIAAVWMLGEQVRARRWIAVFVGFVGVLVIVRPGSSNFSIGNCVDVQRQSTSFEALAAMVYQGFNITEGEAPERVLGAREST